MIKLVTRIGSYLIIAISVVCIILLIANAFIRISNDSGDRSHGVIEEMIFGRSAVSAFFRIFESENLKRWKDSNELSSRAASVIEKNGARLIYDSNLDKERKKTSQMAMRAYNLSNKIPKEYLRASNSELPQYFTEHFVVAMNLWAQGLEEQNQKIVANGVEHYNMFIQWIQSKRRDDFRRMR